MHHYLSDLIDMVTEYEPDYYNWSVWDWNQIHEGDRFFWVKVGMYGQTGIVASGKITSEPYKDEDWSGKGRETYYVDFLPDVVINPDALPILSCKELANAIPDFEWDKGHSGLVLTDEQAEKLEQVWADFLKKHEAAFSDALKKDHLADLIYMQQA
jgi:hypothetical protein